MGSLSIATQPLELEILASKTVADLKRLIASCIDIPVESQRLFVRSCRLADDKPLHGCGLTLERPDVMLVPALTHRSAGGVTAISARRGFHMVSSNTRWRPTGAAALRPQDLLDFFGDNAGAGAAEMALEPPMPLMSGNAEGRSGVQEQLTLERPAPLPRPKHEFGAPLQDRASTLPSHAIST